ncbi:MAG: hypothetical protein DMD35_21385 [Gemmatimonadetes bacterium]|nr:MAG: hypothetical protein DMD35_21385 [Gemmatimonadota bacterium]
MPTKAPSPVDRPARAPRGRPRSEQARRAIISAGLEIVRDEGYQAMTIDAVAKRSGVARTTIYRWWPSCAMLLIDVFLELAAVEAPSPTGPDPLRAIRLELRRIAVVSNALVGRVLLALLGAAQHDPAVRTALLERVIRPRREASARAVRDAQARGLIRDDVNPYVAVDLLYGPIFYRMLVGHEPATERFATQTFERVMEGLGVVTASSPAATHSTSRASRG